MRALICINLHILLLPFFCNSAEKNWMVEVVSHSNIFLFHSMQLRTPKTVARKRKLRASACKGRNRLIWEHLDKRMELLGHLH